MGFMTLTPELEVALVETAYSAAKDSYHVVKPKEDFLGYYEKIFRKMCQIAREEFEQFKSE